MAIRFQEISTLHADKILVYKELHSIIHELPAIALNLEKGLWYTLIWLTTEPGMAIREYLAGKRVRYQHSLAYLKF